MDNTRDNSEDNTRENTEDNTGDNSEDSVCVDYVRGRSRGMWAGAGGE
jgi:hypothetical protein